MLPDSKMFLIAFVIAIVWNYQQLSQITGLPQFIGYLINTALYAIVVLVIIRIIMWIGNKMGMGKK